MVLDPQLLNAGIQRHRAGDFVEARALYEQLLSGNPGEPMVLNLLGAVCLDAGQLAESETFLLAAVEQDPSFAPALDNLGLLYLTENRLPESILYLRRAATTDPLNVQTRRNLAKALGRAGDPAAALGELQQIVQLAADDAGVHHDLARLLWELDRRSEALSHFRQLIRLLPTDSRPHVTLAEALEEVGQYVEAIATYETAARLSPSAAGICLRLSQLQLDRGDLDESIGWSRRAIELHPRCAEAYQNLGCALIKKKADALAIEALQCAVGLDPRLIETGRIGPELGEYRESLAARSSDPDLFYNLGDVFFTLGDLRAAVEQYDRALALQADHAEAHRNRGAVRLLEGRLAEGWPDYEWRLRLRVYSPPPLPGKLWHGEALAGRTILLCYEGGLGDTLQFVRYAPLLKERGARVVVACQTVLREILARTPGIDQLLTPESELHEADLAVRMMSLPERMGTTLETIPASMPYVFADPQRVDAWRRKLAAWDGFKVGIVWQGNPASSNDWHRSILLDHLAPLARVPGVRLVNLQKGPGLEQLPEFAQAWSVIDFGPTVDAAGGAFMDTAAIMKNLDLVITSDTAAAHLAGALGVNVWVALQRVPEWRWLLKREDSPWYPTMRLFRQTGWGDWADVFERMAKALEEIVTRSR